MQTFRYRAISKGGAEIKGIVEAGDQFEAVRKIKENCSVVTEITHVRGVSWSRGTEGKIREKSLALLCSQFSIILGAGLPLLRTVELLAGQTADKTLKRILTEVGEEMAGGSSLAKSLEDRGGHQLPGMFIESVRAGEESGTLEQSFRRLHDYYDKSFRMKSKVKSAMIYPTFTLVVAAVVVVILMIFAVPTFTDSFVSMGMELPWITRALIAVSNFFQRFWLLLALLAATAAAAVQAYGKRPAGRLQLARLRLKRPVLGKIERMRAAAQIADTLCTLVAAGVPLMRSVSITARVLENAFLGEQLLGTLPLMEDGQPLGTSLRRVRALPELLVEMIVVGEETGSLDSTLETVGRYYDNETEAAAGKAVALMEPVIICVLAVVVCILLLAVYLPMFSLYGSL